MTETTTPETMRVPIDDEQLAELLRHTGEKRFTDAVSFAIEVCLTLDEPETVLDPEEKRAVRELFGKEVTSGAE